MAPAWQMTVSRLVVWRRDIAAADLGGALVGGKVAALVAAISFIVTSPRVSESLLLASSITTLSGHSAVPRAIAAEDLIKPDLDSARRSPTIATGVDVARVRCRGGAVAERDRGALEPGEVAGDPIDDGMGVTPECLRVSIAESR